MSNHETATTAETEATPEAKPHHPFIPHFIRIFAIPIIIGWVALTVIVNVAVPTLEVVGEAHSAPMAPLDAPSMKAMMRMGQNFQEFNSNSTVMIVVESQQPLGDAAHHYYDDIVRKLRKDTAHVQHLQDFWGDRFTAAGAQSADAGAPTCRPTSPATRAPRRPTTPSRPSARSSTKKRHRPG